MTSMFKLVPNVMKIRVNRDHIECIFDIMPDFHEHVPLVEAHERHKPAKCVSLCSACLYLIQ